MGQGSQPDPWKAELEVTQALAQALIAAQFPHLAVESIGALGEGWDNAAFIVNGAFVFRFPRRAIAAKLMQTECRVLPLLVSALPLRLPVPGVRRRSLTAVSVAVCRLSLPGRASAFGLPSRRGRVL